MDSIYKSWVPIFEKYNISDILNKINNLNQEYIDNEFNIEIFPKEDNILIFLKLKLLF